MPRQLLVFLLAAAAYFRFRQRYGATPITAFSQRFLPPYCFTRRLWQP
jgi:hypothetical protein